MASSGRVLVLGGGVGGTLVANRLVRARPELDVTVVASHADHLFQPAILRVPFGPVPEKRLRRDERALLHPRVRLLASKAEGLDRVRGTVRLAAGDEVAWDVLVLATGARVAFEPVPGLREAGHHFHCVKAAGLLRDALAAFRGGHIVLGACRLPYKCPPAPFEFACLLDDHLRRDGRRAAARITFVYPERRLFSDPGVADALEPLLAARGIEVRAPFVPARVEPENRRLVSTGGESLDYDLLALVPPHAGAPIVRGSGLGDSQGWLPADPRTLRVAPRIYALGDAAGLPVPKSGAATHAQAGTIVRNVLREVDGHEPDAAYDGAAS
ncbi:MAG: FAD-dependent oxidoreductase [Planctomycetales bacterium]|nr:FAD-dependent oxidoreductase [Planctomycetales bacterium]